MHTMTTLKKCCSSLMPRRNQSRRRLKRKSISTNDYVKLDKFRVPESKLRVYSLGEFRVCFATWHFRVFAAMTEHEDDRENTDDSSQLLEWEGYSPIGLVSQEIIVEVVRKAIAVVFLQSFVALFVENVA